MNTHTIHITLYDTACFGIVFTSLTIAFFLWFTKKINRDANRFLALALLASIFGITQLLYNGDAHMPLQFSLAIGPLIFFYVLKITVPEYKFRLKDLLHFSPLLLGLTVWAAEATYQTSTFHWIEVILQMLAFISISIYLYLCHTAIEHFYRQLKFSGGDRYRSELRWLHNLVKGFGVLSLLIMSVAAACYFYYGGQSAIDAYYPLFFGVMTIWITATVHLRSEAGATAEPSSFLKPSLSIELKRKSALLKSGLKANAYYLDPELTLASLAEKLDLTVHELSRIINSVFKKSFNDFINEYRVADVIRKMQDPAYDHITLLGIAYESGFNSKTSFNRIFKQMTGKNPGEYKNELKKEGPIYNLGRSPGFAAIISYDKSTLTWNNDTKLNRYFMIKNYLKIAWRSLEKNKGFTSINVCGLALGLATCLLIVFYVFDELSYDRYNTKADRVFRVNEEIKFGGVQNPYAITPPAAAAALKADFPEIEQVVRFRNRGGNKVKKGAQSIQEDRMVYADNAIFDVFTLPAISGNTAHALTDPHTLVITESVAKKYFGKTNAVGQVLTFNDTSQFKITAVIKDIPQQSHFHFDFFMSMPTILAESNDNSWLGNNFSTYILLKPGFDYRNLAAKLPEFMHRHAGPQIQTALNMDVAAFEKSGNYLKLTLTPLKNIHLQSDMLFEFEANGSITYVYIFSAIAVFILLIACVNFMNLSTARSANRAREVGVRKVLGSPRKYLVAQFLTESLIVTLAGAIIAVFAAWAFLPLFNQLSGKDLAVTPQILSWLAPALLIIIVVIGCLAGSYPALFLSGFQPIDVLKGKLAAGFKGGALRSVLVVFQFSISIFLIIGTLVIYNQLKYIQSRDIGYKRDHILIVKNIWTLGSGAIAFQQEVKRLAGVQNAALSNSSPTDIANDNTGSFFKSPVIDQKGAVLSHWWNVDENYIPTLGIQMVAGRNFSRDMGTDSSAVLINEAFAKLVGYPNPVGQFIYSPANNQLTKTNKYHIVGVMKDFNFKSLRENVPPLAIYFAPTRTGTMSIRINTADIAGLVAQVKSKWKDISLNQVFNYSFMDKDFDAIYRSEQRMGTISIAFTSLAIIIACLGLFGLAAYAAEQRTKEIGIRKVLGANVSVIVGMLSKDFIKLVIISIVIAAPIAWWAMEKWLQSFAYRQNVQWWVVALAGSGAIIIAFITISFQSVRAAIANPVRSLRSE
ncbi:MAG: ABC transporter permease [Bacteroidota bacterium]